MSTIKIFFYREKKYISHKFLSKNQKIGNIFSSLFYQIKNISFFLSNWNKL